MRKRLCLQIAALCVVAVGFVAFDLLIYFNITTRYISNRSDEMKAKSIEISKYLPFDDESLAKKYENASLSLLGDLPVIDGAAALFPVFSGIVGSIYPKDKVSFDGGDFTKESALQYSNTRGAYKAVVDGTVDVVFCAKPSKEQLEYASEQGVELELVPIGREAFVFVVNTNNTVDNLTLEEIKGIYTGKYLDWSELGGKKGAIDVLLRNSGSGSQTALENLLDGEKAVKWPVVGKGSAIGFSFRFYVEEIVANGGVKMLSVNGVSPNVENVANGTYPIISNFYAVYDKANPNENVKKLIDWILSEEGRWVIEQNGYVPLK